MRINRISITFCALLLTTPSLTSMTHASKQAGESSTTTHITKKADKKESAATTQKTRKVSQKAAKKAVNKSTTKSKTAPSVRESSIIISENAKTRSKCAANKMTSASFTEKCTKRKGYKSRYMKVKNAAPGTLTNAHKTKVQKATKMTMSKLMQRIGKPYRWGGSSSRTGFDCNGLVYYAYKDLAKIRVPRTANEVYHLRNAAPTEYSELKNGDLVFFRTQGHDTVDHVGAYVGNGKSVQSPRTGQEIQTTSLGKDYQQHHYVDTRRVMTPETLR